MRTCGDCQLCCKLIPIKEDILKKPAGQRCRYQRAGKGCTVYTARPMSCRMWSCQWLLGNDTTDLHRPDRAHYVIDIVLDKIIPTIGEQTQEIPVLQVWCDPGYEDAWRDPALLALIERRAEQGIAALIRFNEHDCIIVFAPAMADDHQWHYIDSRTSKNVISADLRSLAGMSAALKAQAAAPAPNPPVSPA